MLVRHGKRRSFAVLAIAAVAVAALVIVPLAPATGVTRQVATFKGGLYGPAPWYSDTCYPGTSLVSNPTANCTVEIHSLSPRVCDLSVGQVGGYATYSSRAGGTFVTIGPIELRGVYTRGSAVLSGAEFDGALNAWRMTVNVVDLCDGDQGTKVFFGDITA